MIWLLLFIISWIGIPNYDAQSNEIDRVNVTLVNDYCLQSLPWVIGSVSAWFTIAYFWNSAMIHRMTDAKFLVREEHPTYTIWWKTSALPAI